MEQVLREILVHLENLERCVHERMLEARKHVVERLANCQPNVMMMILVYLDELERCIDERISETRRDVIEHLANCTPNVTMGGNEQHMRYVAHCETLLDPLLDPAFRGSRPFRQRIWLVRRHSNFPFKFLWYVTRPNCWRRSYNYQRRTYYPTLCDQVSLARAFSKPHQISQQRQE